MAECTIRTTMLALLNTSWIRKWRPWLLAAGLVTAAHAVVVGMAWKAHDLGSGPTPNMSTVQGFVLAPGRPAAADPQMASRPSPKTLPQPASATSPAADAVAAWTVSDSPSHPEQTQTALEPTPHAAASNPQPETLALAAEPTADPQSTALEVAAADQRRPESGFPPTLSQWHYTVLGVTKGFRYNASATLSWQLNDAGYKANMTMRAFLVGSRSQESTGTVGPNGLQPSTFIDQARRERKLTFDWHSDTAHSSETAEPLQLMKGTQDRLSLFLQLSNLLSGLQHTPKAGQRWTLPVAGMNKVEPWVFEWTETSSQHLPAGTFMTWKLTRQPRHSDDQTVEVWFAPSLHHLPVRIRLSSPNGDVVDQQLAPS